MLLLLIIIQEYTEKVGESAYGYKKAFISHIYGQF